MRWQSAEALLAAKNATVVRAALRKSINATEVWDAWLLTHPQKSDNITLDRAKARAWAMLNVEINDDLLAASLRKMYAEAWVLGESAADDMLTGVTKAQKPMVSTDWDKWKPGDAAAAALLRPKDGLKSLLSNAGLVIKGIKKTGYERIGTALADAVAAGMSDKGAAKLLLSHISNPARALTIAVTEQNRAVSAATVQRYRDAGLEQMEWMTSNPCPSCAMNSGQVVQIGSSFESGHTQPPAHPHCRCALLPIMEGLTDLTAGSMIPVTTPPPAPVSTAKPSSGGFVKGQWTELSEDEKREQLLRSPAYAHCSRQYAEQLLAKSKADQVVIKGRMFQNGEVQARFYGDGMQVKPKIVQQMLDHLDELQASNPQGEVVFHVGDTSVRNAYGWAQLGGKNVWLHPKTAINGLFPNTMEGGSFKMPSLRDNPQWRYTLTHEWGHHIDETDLTSNYRIVQSKIRAAAVKRLIKDNPDGFLSGYGRKNTMESVAEMFAEWFLTKGKTANTLVQAAATEFGWQV